MLPNILTVVNAQGLRALLAEGCLMEVACVERAQKRYNTWVGGWIVHALVGSGRDRKLLVTDRRGQIQAREFKTTVGLISYLHDHGFDPVSIPMKEGRVVLYNPADREGSG